MCPECFATIALLVTGVVSTGGATAAAVKLFRNKKTVSKLSEIRSQQISNVKEKEK